MGRLRRKFDRLRSSFLGLNPPAGAPAGRPVSSVRGARFHPRPGVLPLAKGCCAKTAEGTGEDRNSIAADLLNQPPTPPPSALSGRAGTPKVTLSNLADASKLPPTARPRGPRETQNLTRLRSQFRLPNQPPRCSRDLGFGRSCSPCAALLTHWKSSSERIVARLSM